MRRNLWKVLSAVLLVCCMAFGLAACKDAPVTYTVTYALGDHAAATATVPTQDAVESGTEITLAAAPDAADDWRFTGWLVSGEDTARDAGSAYTVTGNVTITAQWESTIPVVTYTVMYERGDHAADTAAVPALDTVESGTTITLASALEGETGYAFTGWLVNGEGEPLAAGATLTVTGNVTITAQWEKIPLTVTFDGNGATAGEVPAPVSDTIGESISLPSRGTLEREGYLFLGWAATADATEALTGRYTVTDNVTLYAVWTRAYNVTYSLGDVSGETPTQDPVALNTEITLPAAPEATGWRFDGWLAGGGSEPLAAGATYKVTGDVTFTAQWTLVYSVTYSIGDHAASTFVPTQDPVEANTEITLADALSPVAGWRFAGWKDGGLMTIYEGGAKYTVTSNVNFYAEWEEIDYDITFDGNGATGGEAPAKMTGNLNDAIDLPGAGTLVRTGYTFAGWATTASAAEAIDGKYTVTGNATLYAVWTINEYTISFDGNGATLGTAPADMKADYNTQIDLPGAGTLARTGYSFAGWATTASGSAIEGKYTVTDNATLYAVWTINEYTVTFDGNGATGGEAPAAVTENYNTQIDLPGAGTLVRTGYTFAGWAATDDAASAIEGKYTVTDNATLYAVWTINEYTVTFDGNGATGGEVPAAVTENYNTQIELPAAGTLARTGYAFAGWATTASGSAIEGKYTVTGNATLYAVWTAIPYNITYTLNEGTNAPSNPATYTVESETITLAAPTRDGYTFTGWTYEGQTTPQMQVTIEQGSTGDKAFTANWEKIVVSYDVIYYSGVYSLTENTPATTQVAAGEKVTFLANPWTRTGYTFAGWKVQHNTGTAEEPVWKDISADVYQPSATYTMPEEAIRIVAKWDAVTITVNFDANGGSGTQAAGSVTFGSRYVLPAVTFTAPAGSSFIGWSLDKSTVIDGEGISRGDYESYVTGENTLTLYAMWQEATFANIADYAGVWTSGSSELVIVAQAGEGEAAYVGIAIVDGKYLVALYQTTSGGFYGVDYQYTCYEITPVSGGVQLDMTATDTTSVTFTSKTAVGDAAATDTLGKWTKSTTSQNWLITASVAYYGINLSQASVMFLDKYVVLIYSQGSTDYIHILTKNDAALTGYYMDDPEKDPEAATFNAGTFYTLSVDGVLNQFVASGSAPTAVEAPAAPEAGQVFDKWVIADTNTEFSFSEVMTADTSITATFKADSSQTSDAYTGSYEISSIGTVVSLTVNDDKSVSYATSGGTTGTATAGSSGQTGWVEGADASLASYWYVWFGSVDYGIALSTDGNTLYLCSNQDVVVATFTKGGTTEPEPTTYTVTFDPNNEGATWTEQVEATGTVAKPQTDPTISSGKVFRYWALDGSEYDFNTPVTGNITLTATYAWCVTFDGNGATGSVDPVYTTMWLRGIELPGQGNLVKEGFTFGGWSDGETIYQAGETFTGSGNHTLTAVWNAIVTEAVVTFDPANGTETWTVNVTLGETVAKPVTDPLDEGGVKTFRYWTLNGAEYDFNEPVTGNITLVAVYAYLISFDINGATGTTPAAIFTGYRAKLPTQGDLVKEGFTFGGWSDGTTTYAGDAYYAPSKSITLTAVWNVVEPVVENAQFVGVWSDSSHEVVIDSQAGYDGVSFYLVAVIDGKMYAAEEEVSTSATRTLKVKGADGNAYTLALNEGALTVTPSGGSAFTIAARTSDSVPTVNTSEYLGRTYATANGISLAISYDSEMATAVATVGETPYYVFGYAGAYVYCVEMTNGAYIVAKLADTQITYIDASLGTVTFYLQYTITFDANGGTGDAPAAVKGIMDAQIDLPAAGTLVRTGYTFAGWATTASGSAIDGKYTVTGNATLYAVWTINEYTVTFDANGATGGDAPEAVKADYNTQIDLPAAGTLVRTGYSFAGWATTASGSAIEGQYTVTDNVTLYAVWTINEYTVTFDGNGATGGDAPAAVTENYNTQIDLPAAGTLVRTGYTFAGWAASASAAEAIDGKYTVTGNVTLYAVWTPIAPSVSVEQGDVTGTAPTITPVWNAEKAAYEITLPANPFAAPTGKYFAGWTVTVNSGSEVVLQPEATKEVAPAATVVIVPTWESYSAEHPLIVGTPGNTDGYPGYQPKWVGTIAKGEKVVLTGTQTSTATANYHSVVAYLYSGTAPQGFFRIDWWVLDAGNVGAGADLAAAEGWTITKTVGPNWDTLLSTLNGTMEVTFDWSTSRVITLTFVATNGSTSNTMSYTIAPASGSSFKNSYNIGLACEASCYTVTSIVCTTGVTPPTVSENQTNPVVGSEDLSLAFTATTPVWIGNSFTSGKKVTITGTLKSAGVNGWEVPIAYIMSTATNSSMLRTDGFNGGTDSAEGWTVVSVPGISGADSNYLGEGVAASTADTEFLAVIKAGCTFTLTYDWTDTSKIVITAVFTNGTTTRTTTFTITATEFATQYWIGLGGEKIYLQVSSITRT